jgi:hypothetical protein
VSESRDGMTRTEIETTRAQAHLPGLDIEIVHGRAPAGDAEYLSVNLRAMPSFAAFGRALEGNNPFTLWTQAMQLAFLPWTAFNPFLPWRNAAQRLSLSDSAAAPGPRLTSDSRD